MRNRAVGEFAATAAILCTFFFALRASRAQIKVITPTTANDYRFLRLRVVLLWCADVLCNFSNCLTLELQKICLRRLLGRKREPCIIYNVATFILTLCHFCHPIQ